MRSMQTFITTAVVSLGGAAFASGPAGVWSEPASVTILEADSDQPLVVIQGLFTVWTGEGPVGSDWGMLGYEAGVRGEMFYECAAGDKALCLMQWDEIKTAASEDGCVGWGSQEAFAGTVHAIGATANAEPYPIDQGVIQGVTPCNYLAGIPEDPPVEPSPEETPEEANADVPVPVEVTVEPGPEPTPEAPAETVASDTAVTSTDTAPGADTVGGTESEGGGCSGGAAGLVPGLGALLGLIGVATRRRR